MLSVGGGHTCASIVNVWVALVALLAYAGIPLPVGGIRAVAVLAHASVFSRIGRLGAPHGVTAVADGPVEPKGHAPSLARVHRQSGRRSGSSPR